MEMKDKLKVLRQEKGLTQAQLAEILFVSRSTVAKWENGLGLPNADSMAALETLYGISREDVATSEPEAVIVEKNRRLRRFGQVLGWTVFWLLTAVSIVLPFAIFDGHYGLTADMAAGVFADNSYIDTGDYRIYYTTFAGDWEDGRHWEFLSSWRPVKKHFWGWTVSEGDYNSRVVTKNNYVVGRLSSIKGKNGYYHMLNAHITSPLQQELVTVLSVRVDGVDYPVEQGFFFITPEPVEFFRIGETFFNVE